jgi:uncharacterized peroxidase-related enzyme
MPHIPLTEGLPGIRALFAFRPETAQPLCDLVNVLLHDRHTLSPGERELIATYVSSQNDCFYCQTIHGAIAAHQLDVGEKVVEDVKRDFESAGISSKLKALLAIADKVRQGGKSVLPEDVERAWQQGATDLEIHDTVLIAAAFCMYNRYVDGLATWAPTDLSGYRERAGRVAAEGYSPVPQHLLSAK